MLNTQKTITFTTNNMLSIIFNLSEDMVVYNEVLSIINTERPLLVNIASLMTMVKYVYVDMITNDGKFNVSYRLEGHCEDVINFNNQKGAVIDRELIELLRTKHNISDRALKVINDTYRAIFTYVFPITPTSYDLYNLYMVIVNNGNMMMLSPANVYRI